MSDQSITSSRENSPITIVVNDVPSENKQQVELNNEQFHVRTKIVYTSQKQHHLQQTATCMTFLLRKMAQETRKFVEHMQTKDYNEIDEKRFYHTLKRSTKIIMKINDFNDEMDEAENYIIPILTEIYKP